jgi:choline-sulfatase
MIYSAAVPRLPRSTRLSSRSTAARKWSFPLAATLVAIGLITASCGGTSKPAAPPPSGPQATAKSLVIVTIDTLRADHVGAYGYPAARTPALDRVAREGARFDRAFATAPITLTSHASLLSGRYPPGHGARHNGMAMEATVPTLATVLRAGGFATAAFIAAFPLDRRFGLARGFDVYSDRMPRDANGRLLNERPGRQVVDEALAWLGGARGRRFFLWVHLFEPHAPYGDPQRTPGRSAVERYDDEVAVADEQVGRLLDAVRAGGEDTAIVVAGDHGEGLGDHGEITHSIFVYDTTLRAPLLVAGPGVPHGLVVPDSACLTDIVPTVLRLLGLPGADTDGIDLTPTFAGARLPARELYAESFAPLLEFGWSPLRVVRSSRWKYIAAPRAELYDVERDAAELHNQVASDPREAERLRGRAERYSPADLPREGRVRDADTASRLQALGYVSGRSSDTAATARPDPKDRRDLAARIGMVISGELYGQALRDALGEILRDDPADPLAHLRLGWVLLESRDHAQAERHFAAAIAGRMPSADPYLGLAACQAARGAVTAALETLGRVPPSEKDNAVVLANIGVLEGRLNHPDRAIRALARAVELDPDFHEARFNLARAYARAGQRAQAGAETLELLRRLPADAPQRPEVERLLAAVR